MGTLTAIADIFASPLHPTTAAMPGSSTDQANRDTDALKRLMVLLLLKLGSSSEEIAGALGVDPSVVRRMVPSAKVKKLV